MEKRACLAIALSILVLVIYQEWVTRYYGVPPPPSKGPIKQETERPAPPQPTAPAPVTPSAPAVQTAKAAKDIKVRSEEHTSELQSRFDLVCRLLLEKKKQNKK